MNPYRKRSSLLFVIAIVWLAITGCKQHQAVQPPQTAEDSRPPSASPAPEPPPPGKQQDADPSPSSNPAAPEEKSFKVKLSAVGDVLIHSSVYKDAQTPEGYDFKPMFEPVKRYIEDADIALANQESMIGGEELGLSDYPRFNGPAEVGDALKDAGFDVVNLANNHTLDRGEQAVLNTIRRYKDLGMVYTGAYMSDDDRRQLRTLDKNGISFAFLSYTYGTNGIPVPEGKEYLLNIIDLPKIRKEVAEARKQADVVVVSFHFGQEYADMPNDEQKEVARAAAEAGAAVVIGHHPHVLQPAEWIGTADGRQAFVVYSLGNFIAAQEGDRKRIGGIIQLEVEKTVKGDDIRIQVKRPSFIPTWIHRVNWRKYKVEPLRTVEESQLPHAGAAWREIADHMKQWMPELDFPAS
ncbi:CapA family protein [Paenibacillus hemerocallicola]|uniref:CapA family protein n=1 Tax=Paenibacillus hemerocallicola TaxID=1172614 RepID=A0A5C4T369_9BACL|nr:CapA family protein [Paenibacillus hemerocallicola]TNJ63471.1 CapA family protein [Paenibacillus hemerocallicola]